MIISFVVAMSKNRVIGKDNSIPWNMPADFKHMRELTIGKPLIMGRKTHESIGKPLPNRTNIILTRDKNYKSEGCTVVHSVEDALNAAEGAKEAIIFGGEDIYKLFLSKADKMYLTIIDAEIDGDTYFPEFKLANWEEIYHIHHPKDDRHTHDFSFVTLEKKK